MPEALCALTRATRISERAAAVGFDWTCLADIRAKVAEELGELDSALATANQRCSAEVIEEFGDLLVALVNLSRHLRMDPEAALRAANQKFIRRFRRIEELLAAQGREPAQSTLAEMDELWDQAKREERKS